MPREPLSRRYRRFWRPDPARDVDDELAFHLEMRAAELRQTGMGEAEARETAMKRFGSYNEIREACHELGRERVARERRTDRLNALRQDLHFAFRTLGTNRAFAAVVALTMTIGIGANAAVFSVTYGVLLRPLPYRDAGRLVRLWSKQDARGLAFFSISPADFREWRASRGPFQAMGAFERQHDATLVRGDRPESVEAAAVMPEVFDLLGTPALLGRTFAADDARPAAVAPAVALVSHALWATRFGADPAAVGSTVTVDGSPLTIVGVMPPRFVVPGSSAELWTPLALAGASEDHGNRYLRVLARLATNTSIEAAKAEMDAVARRLAQASPSTNSGWSVNILSVPEIVVGTAFRRATLVLLGVVGLVLLIACANAANLQLARAAARAREIALRTALGATRWRIVRQLLTESLVLAVVGGAGGLLLAYGGLALLRRLGSEMVPRLGDVRLDLPVLAFTAVLSLGSGVLFAILPALRLSRADAGEALKAGGRVAGHDGVSMRLRSALVVAEIAMSLVLLIGAGLLMRSFLRLQLVDLGFDPRGLTVAPLRLPDALYPDTASAARFLDAVLERVRAVPGVTGADVVNSAPFAGPNTGNVFARADRPLGAREQAPDADYRVITPGYLRTMGIRLVRGRNFTDQDRAGSPPVVLISETAARRGWPGEDPVGRTVRVGDVIHGTAYTVAGVVADARYQTLETPDVRPMIYFPARAVPPHALAVVARSSNENAPASVRAAVASVDPRLAPPTVVSVASLMDDATSTRRFALVLLATFAGVALLLAAIGVYGVMSYLVRQRMHELGVRVALGAPARVLVGSVVGRTLRLTAAAVVVGLAGAWALTRVLGALLFEVDARDPATFASIAALMGAVALVASALPARRATKADPMVALRD